MKPMKLTLKDLFAMAAMQAIITNAAEREGCPVDREILATEAYEIAFAMWEEREKLQATQVFNDSAIDLK